MTETTGNPEKEILTWDMFGRAAQSLAHAIYDDGFMPDIILSVARGGMLLGAHLGYTLGIKDVSVISVEFYTAVNEHHEKPVILPPTPPKEHLEGKRILIVDDVADTGGTMNSVLGFLDEVAEEVRVAVLYEKPISVVHCDYIWKNTPKWIVFPWSDIPPITGQGVSDA